MATKKTKAQGAKGYAKLKKRGRSKTEKYRRKSKAKDNPLIGGLEALIPAGIAAWVGGPRNLLIGAGIGASAVGWYWYRTNEREKLVRAINNNNSIFGIRAYFRGAKVKLPPEQQWLTQADGPEKKAAEVITLTNTTNAAQGIQQIMSELPAIPAAPPGAISQLLSQGIETFEGSTGIKVPQSVKAEAEKYTKTEQAQSANQIAAQTKTLWDWMYGLGGKANENPNLSWGDYLGYTGSL